MMAHIKGQIRVGPTVAQPLFIGKSVHNIPAGQTIKNARKSGACVTTKQS